MNSKELIAQLDSDSTKLGDIRKIAKEIKRDHTMAMELWASGAYFPRQLAFLIMDKKQLSEDVIDQFLDDISQEEEEQKLHLADWFMANQLMKDKRLVGLIESWRKAKHPLKRRIFWYYQARLRWMGKTDFPNTEELLGYVEKELTSEVPEVQWAMNYLAAQVGVHDDRYRERCVKIGEDTGLFKDEIVPRNCTPSYLPEFIRIEVAKRA